AVTLASVLMAAAVATSTIGVGQANALTGWTPYTVIRQTTATVGSVAAIAEIRRGKALNTYYTKITCEDGNPAATSVSVYSGSSWSWNAKRKLGVVSWGLWDPTTAVGYSDPYIAYNDELEVQGTCEYYYRDFGFVETPWSAVVWVGYWTG